MRYHGTIGIVIGCVLGTGSVGCSGTTGSNLEASSEIGSLSLSLTGSAASGAQYHLANAVFEVTNFFVSPPIDMFVQADDPSLQIDLPSSVFPFDYRISLQDGWTLNSVDADGAEHTIGATLLNNLIPFTIKPRRTTPVVFSFKASEQVVTVGSGSVGVGISIDDSLIDDFEDGDGLLAPIGGRNGAWGVFNDGTGTQVPAPGAQVVAEVVDTSANFVFHMTGSGFAPLGTVLPDGSGAFGAGVAANMLVDMASGKVLPYDASKFSGIDFTFFTKAPADLPIQVSFIVNTMATTPVDQGGTCTAGCYDGFAFVGLVPPGDFSFSGGFAWGQLRQQGWGTPAEFDPSTITDLTWVVGFPNFGQPAAANVFDFRLDDVAFHAAGGLSTLGNSLDAEVGARPISMDQGGMSAGSTWWSAK